MRASGRTASVAVAVGLLGTVGLVSPAYAASCGQVVTSDIKLTGDIGPCPGDGLVAGKSGITIDLNGHRVFGVSNTKNKPQVGVRVSFRENVTVKNGRIDHFNTGVYLEAGGHHLVRGITALDNVGTLNQIVRDGILMSGSNGNTVVNNVARRNATNRFPSGGISMINDASDNTVAANEVTDNAGTGIRIDPGMSMHNVISGNLVLRNQGNGVLFHFGAARNTATGNVIQDNGGTGVNILNDAGFVTISGNLIERNGGGGISVGWSHITVENNIVSNNRFTGIVVGGGNLFLAPGTGGPIQDFIRRDNTVQGNQVMNNTGNGIVVQCPVDSVSPSPPPVGTRGTCLSPDNNYGFDIGQRDHILHNQTFGNGGTDAGMQIRDPVSGRVTGVYDLLDQNEKPPCDHNTWKGNTYTNPSTTFPSCTRAP